MQVRKCTRCFKVKQLDKFAKNARNKSDGCQPKCKACNKEYYLANQEEVIARVRNYYKENNNEILKRRVELRKRPEAKIKKAQQDKAWRINNKEYVSERYKEYVKLNRQRIRDYWKQWYHNSIDYNRMYGRVSSQKRRAEIKQNGNNTLTLEQTIKLFDNHPYCKYCNKINVKLTIDHIVPISRGGQNCLGNVTIACETCNFSKGSKLLEEWLQTLNT